MIARALHALGFGQKSMPTAIATNDQALRAMTASRDDWKRLAEETGERFKLATTDLAKQADEIERLNREVDGKIGVIDSLYTRIDELRPDALLWRAAREKRAARKGSVS